MTVLGGCGHNANVCLAQNGVLKTDCETERDSRADAAEALGLSSIDALALGGWPVPR